MFLEGNILKDINITDFERLKGRFHEIATRKSEEYLPEFNSEYESLAYSLGLAYGEGYSIVNYLVKQEVIPYILYNMKIKMDEALFYEKMKKFSTWDEVFQECTEKYTKILNDKAVQSEDVENDIEEKVVSDLRGKVYSVIMNVYETLEEIIKENLKK